MEVEMKYKINLQVKESDYNDFRKLNLEYREEGYNVIVLFSDMMAALKEKKENGQKSRSK